MRLSSAAGDRNTAATRALSRASRATLAQPRIKHKRTSHLFKTEMVRTFDEIVGPVVAPDGRAGTEEQKNPPIRCGWMPLLSERRDGGILGVGDDGKPNGDIYFMGIIDILQQCVCPPARTRAPATGA